MAQCYNRLTCHLHVQGIQDAFVTISLVGEKGSIIGQPQDTPTTNNLAGNYILFNDVQVRIPNSSEFFLDAYAWCKHWQCCCYWMQNTLCCSCIWQQIMAEHAHLTLKSLVAGACSEEH